MAQDEKRELYQPMRIEESGDAKAVAYAIMLAIGDELVGLKANHFHVSDRMTALAAALTSVTKYIEQVDPNYGVR